VAGPDRWSTAAAAAQRIGVAPGGEILLALGRHPEPIRAWPDAVASGALQAGGEPLPLLLTAGDALPPQTRLALEQLRAQGAGRVLIFGGTGAIGTAVEEQVATLGLQTQRVAGVNRFATSTAAVQAARSRGANDNAVMVARADAYPDALSAAALAARTSTPLLLVDSCDLVLREATAQWFEANPGLTQARVIGGPKAVSERVRWQLDTRLTP
jgi:putative cell wall-binding protein